MAARIYKKHFEQNLGTAGINENISFKFPFIIKSVQIHASANITETIILTIKHHNQTDDYDVVLATLDVNNLQDSFNAFGEAYSFEPNDILEITSTSAGSQIVYGTVIVEER